MGIRWKAGGSVKGKIYIDPIQPKNLRDEEVILFQIDDYMRAQWLLKNGYLPRFIGAVVPEFSNELLEWAFYYNHAPVYWRPATPGERPGGSVYDRPGDRDRIDKLILEARRVSYPPGHFGGKFSTP
jgi:hypothetical protein